VDIVSGLSMSAMRIVAVQSLVVSVHVFLTLRKVHTPQSSFDHPKQLSCSHFGKGDSLLSTVRNNFNS